MYIDMYIVYICLIYISLYIYLTKQGTFILMFVTQPPFPPHNQICGMSAISWMNGLLDSLFTLQTIILYWNVMFPNQDFRHKDGEK